MTMPDDPQWLYKYRAFGAAHEHLQDILINNRLWAGTAQGFNDPFDCMPVVDTSGTRDEMIRWAKDRANRWLPGDSRQVKRQRVRELVEILRKGGLGTDPANQGGADAWRTTMNDFGVLSLTEDPTNILMWGHYGDSHKGYCLRFDPKKGIFRYAHKVAYSQDRPVFRVFDPDRDNLAERCLLRKADIWSYEREWRFISFRKVGLVEFPPDALTGIILGANVSAADCEKVFELVEKRPGELEVLQTKLDPKRFVMNLRPTGKPKRDRNLP